ncbi:CapA family protein [Planomicrobium sp. CPCC 101079]|uniref:CapA family protein n=1 Tax=Planomicrobium sp. CPCC 101079 TaxID=2599618 RepID=UPI0011B8151C|nr:CapA family protein [Planomicrobium sp. CPCC 101079]TWT01593.1 CapA family protein [Planomicrobium sp. CPCC 101079]
MISFTATGDSFITRKLPAKDAAFNELSSIIQSSDVRFTNLEITTHHFEGFPSAVSGGTWAVAPPHVLNEIKEYGFNLVGWANNHTLDYSHGGLQATEKYLNEYGFVHAGAGDNLAKASEPKYLDTPSGRVAIIAATSSFHESAAAGEQRPDMVGRPGVNPLRFKTVHNISPEKSSYLKMIAETVEINAEKKLQIKNGYEVGSSDDSFSFGTYLFRESEEEGKTTMPLQKDVDRIVKAISEAKRQADYVLVSIHAHEMKGASKELPAEFLETFSRICIDEGAHSVIGHGPHVIRGIEIYKNRPIFYSLGNFIFQNETVTHLPDDFYKKYELDHSHTVADAFDARSKNNTIGYGTNKDIWTAILPYWTMEDGELKELVLYPIELGFGEPRYKKGWPSVDKNVDILKKLQKLSAPYGTKIEIEGSVGRVILKADALVELSPIL